MAWNFIEIMSVPMPIHKESKTHAGKPKWTPQQQNPNEPMPENPNQPNPSASKFLKIKQPPTIANRASQFKKKKKR